MTSGYPPKKTDPTPQYYLVDGSRNMRKLKLKGLTTAQRDALDVGSTDRVAIFNITTSQWQGWNGTEWVSFVATALDIQEYIIPVFTKSSTLTADTDVAPTLVTPTGSIEGIKARGYVKTAPTGADLIIDINYDGTTIFTNQAHRLTIAAGANSGETSDLDVSDYADNKTLTIDIDQIGSTIAGADLTVELICKVDI